MAELFQKIDEKDCQKISEDFKNVVREQSNIETREDVRDHRRNAMPDVLPL